MRVNYPSILTLKKVGLKLPRYIHCGILIKFITNIFWCQNRAALAQIIFDALNGNNIWQKCTKICQLVQKLK
jgi:hypothetical protein